MASIKFLLLVFICIGIWQKFRSSSRIRLDSGRLFLSSEGGGIREVAVDATIGKLTGGLTPEASAQGGLK